MATKHFYVMGALPQQADSTLKSAVERELRKVSAGIDAFSDSLKPADLNNYLRKDDTAPLQVSEAQTQFNDAVSFWDDINVDKASTASVYPLVDFSKAQYVSVPLTPSVDAHASSKKYNDDTNTATQTAAVADAKAYTDSLDVGNVKILGNQTVNGSKIFSSNVEVPLVPISTTHATSKQYVDTHPGLASAYVTFNGATGAILGTAYNVSSVTRNSEGNYTVNFTNPLANGNYAWSSSVQNVAGNPDSNANTMATNGGKLESSLTVQTRRSIITVIGVGLLPAPFDYPTVSVTIHGGH